MNEEIIYQVKGSRSFAETVEKVQENAKSQGFGVQYIHDVQATLAGKGFEQSPLKIIEICQPKYAHAALGKNTATSLLMPCRVNVLEDQGQVVISTLLPLGLVGNFGNPALNELARMIDEALKRIVDDSI